LNILEVSWEDTLPIRHRVLWPDKPIHFCKVEGDETGLHFGVELTGTLVCVASIYIEGDSARLRKFATLAEYQGQKIGSTLLQYMHDHLVVKGDVKYFWCDARETAVGFYERFGMKVSGDKFLKSGTAYFKMEKQLI